MLASLILALCGFVQADPPDGILVIVLDDVTTWELGCYAGRVSDPAVTPNLDDLAENGVQFLHCWSSPLCSSTRAALFTGRFGYRTGVGTAIPQGNDGPGLPLDETTFAEMLQSEGWDTALFGKWHLGYDAAEGGLNAANDQGFDHYLGTIANINSPYTYSFWAQVEDGSPGFGSGYCTSAYVDEALDWIGDRETNWLAVVSFNAAHAPFHNPPPGLHTQGPLSGDTRRNFRAMVEAADTEIGRLVAGLPEDVLILIVGDNGTPIVAVSGDVPDTQAKRHLYEGGINVPLIVAGYGVVSHGRTVDAMVSVADFYATLADAAGLSPDLSETDSVSFAPYLVNPSKAPIRSTVYAEIFNEAEEWWAAAACDGKYKLILSDGYEWHTEPEELFNMATDPDEESPMDLESLSPAVEARYDALRALILSRHPL